MNKVLTLTVLVLMACSALAQAPATAPSLSSVLAGMDKAAANFRTAQADFKFDQFESAVSEHDLQSGTIYFHKTGSKIEYMAHVTQPANQEKYALYDGSTVILFQKATNQKTEYSVGKNKEMVETFLVLGFGSSGQDLRNAFEVTLDGSETVDGVNTARLLLVPKSQKVKNVFDRIYLWIDPARGISLRQKFMEPQTGNYRDAYYTNIKLNQSLPGDAFKLPTNNKTTTVRPQG